MRTLIAYQGKRYDVDTMTDDEKNFIKKEKPLTHKSVISSREAVKTPAKGK